MKKSIKVDPHQIQMILNARNNNVKIEDSGENNSFENNELGNSGQFTDIKNAEIEYQKQLDVLFGGVLKKAQDEKPKMKYLVKGFIFNVYRDEKNNFTRFIASIGEFNQHVEYHVVGTKNSIGKTCSESTIEMDEREPMRHIKVNDEEFEVYNKNKTNEYTPSNQLILCPDLKCKKGKIGTQKNVGKFCTVCGKETVSMSNISGWINYLSFYNPNSMLDKISFSKLKESEIEELILALKKDIGISQTTLLIIIKNIRETENLKKKDLKHLDDSIRQLEQAK